MNLLRRLFGGAGRHDTHRSSFPQPAPAETFYAVGDVHGCTPLLRRLLGQIRDSDPDAPVVCVGDYIDRGEDSAGTLACLREMASTGAPLTCLAGNHEAMLLKFLEDPEKHGDRWLRYGGLQTLASFGVGRPAESQGRNTAMRDALAEAMGPALTDWIRELPARWVSGNVAVVHAGADPQLPLELQSDGTLKWGHPEFATTRRSDGVWVIHGHTITERPELGPGRVGIDTGAYASGRLTAVRVGADGTLGFLST